MKLMLAAFIVLASFTLLRPSPSVASSCSQFRSYAQMAHDGVLQAEAWSDEGNDRLAKSEFDVANHNVDVAEKYGTFIDCVPRADWAKYLALKSHIIAYEAIHHDTPFPDLKRDRLEFTLSQVKHGLIFAKVGSEAYESIKTDMLSLKKNVAFWKDAERRHPEETSTGIARSIEADDVAPSAMPRISAVFR